MTESTSFALTDLLALVRRHWWITLGVFAATVAAVAGYTASLEPQYRAEALVLVRTNVNQNLFPLGDTGGTRLVRFLPSELEYTQSDDFERQAELAAPGDTTVEVSARENIEDESPNVLTFEAKGPDSDTVANSANAWAQTYVELRHQVDVTEIEATISTLDTTAEDLRARRAVIVAPLQPLDDAIAATTDPTTLSQLTTQRLALLQGLNTELAPLETQLRSIEEQLAALDVDQSFMVETETSARVIRSADRPEEPFEPSWPANLALGTLIGAILAIGAAYTVDRLADRVSDVADEAEALGLVELASIPRAEPVHLTAQALIGGEAPAALEGFHQLVTSLEIILSDSDSSTVAITSADQGEGKSTVAVGIGAVLAGQGLKVLLIDADMRRPSLHEGVGVANRWGLASLLEGQTTIDDTLLEPPELTTMAVIPAGHPHTNPADLLRTDGLDDLMAVARERFDRVIIDAPPVLPVTDATPLARASDLVLVVARPGQTRRRQLARAIERLRQNGAVVGGLVENGTRQRDSDYETYGVDRD